MGAMMTHVAAASCWRLVDALSSLLDPYERDAVLGDLTERNMSSCRALGNVLGLVLRRQAGLWVDWHQWAAVMGVAIPLGVLLSHASRWFADVTALALWRYLLIWDWGYLAYAPWRHDLLDVIGRTIVAFTALAGWSWTAGYAMGMLSRRALWMTTSLFAVVIFASTFGTTTMARGNGAFVTHFYSVVFPRLVRFVLVMLPALWGMRVAISRRRLRLMSTIGGALALVLLTVSISRGLESSLTLGRHVIPQDAGPDRTTGTDDDLRPFRLIPLVMLWPMGFVIVRAGVERWRGDGSQRPT